MVAPNLQTLKLERCSGLEEIIHDPQVSNISFQCLREIQVTCCNNLKYIFPISVADSLGQLHTLKIKNCSQLEDIIQDPQVSYINLQSLREVEVNECNNLKYLFPQSVAKTLGQLQTLKMSNCSQLEKIIQGTQVSNISPPQTVGEYWSIYVRKLKARDVKDIMPTKSSLQKLIVNDCPQLTPVFISDNLQ
ncbi:hypothetical protein Goari_020706, partial [Gossypium aridum]|nr:hypothetical protein [Gossypium aridum]